MVLILPHLYFHFSVSVIATSSVSRFATFDLGSGTVIMLPT